MRFPNGSVFHSIAFDVHAPTGRLGNGQFDEMVRWIGVTSRSQPLRPRGYASAASHSCQDMAVVSGQARGAAVTDEQAAKRATEAEDVPIGGIDTSVAHPARVYDYWLGGKDNFSADREAAERVLAATPGLRFRVRANRAFLARAVRYLAGEAGIRQFLDIGTVIPSANNTH